MTGRMSCGGDRGRSQREAIRRVAMVLILCGLLMPVSSGALARSRANNGWEAGSSSDTVSGRVGKKKAAPPKKSSGGKTTTKRCTSRACKAAPKKAGGGAESEALKTVRLPAPQIVANPSAGGLPGVTTFFWAVLPSQIDFDLSIDGMSTRLTATPLRMTWHLSDGRVLPGVPSQADEAHAQAPATGTGLDFESPGIYQVRAVADWDVAWSTNDGESGKVDGRQSSAVVDYSVGERRSVLTGGH